DPLARVALRAEPAEQRELDDQADQRAAGAVQPARALIEPYVCTALLRFLFLGSDPRDVSLRRDDARLAVGGEALRLLADAVRRRLRREVVERERDALPVLVHRQHDHAVAVPRVAPELAEVARLGVLELDLLAEL